MLTCRVLVSLAVSSSVTSSPGVSVFFFGLIGAPSRSLVAKTGSGSFLRKLKILLSNEHLFIFYFCGLANIWPFTVISKLNVSHFGFKSCGGCKMNGCSDSLNFFAILLGLVHTDL